MHAIVARLRRLLVTTGAEGDGARLDTSLGRYRLVLPPDCVDAVVFTSLVRQGEEALVHDPARAAAMFESGLALWGGTALEDLGAHAGLRAEKVRLDELWLTAAEGLAEARLWLGDSRQVVADLRHLLELHPDRERLAELLMVGLYVSGQQTDALGVYERLRARLSDDFGLDPSRGLRDTHQAILEQHDTLYRPALVAALLRGEPGLSQRAGRRRARQPSRSAAAMQGFAPWSGGCQRDVINRF